MLKSGEIIRIVGGVRTPNSNQNCWEVKGRILERYEVDALSRIDPNGTMSPFDPQIEGNLNDYVCTISLPDSEIKYVIIGGKV